jgi:DNA topoisomerase-1
LLRDFWEGFSAAVGETKDLKISQVISTLDELLEPHIFPKGINGDDPRKCPSCGDGRLNLKLGRFGAFIGCSNYPECRFTRKLGTKPGEDDASPRVLGNDPDTGEPIELKVGRFGPYVQRGDGDKPARSGIPKGMNADTVDLEYALKLLSLPREIGVHPETGKPITTNFGRFGPYVASDGQYASLDSPEDVFTVGINRAVTLLAERKAKGRGRRQAEALKDLGAHPETKAPVKVLKGRYGPYVSDGTTNATIPDGIEPTSVTMEQAVEWLAARAAKGGKKKAKAAKPKAAAKKAIAAKPVAAKPAKPKPKPKAKKLAKAAE